jgi:hypothetical protein
MTTISSPNRSVLHALALFLVLLWVPLGHAAPDHSHAVWDGLLRRDVVIAPSGVASTVRYAAMRQEHSLLRSYLDSLSAVSPDEYRRWTKPQQLAFLINAYNAFTVELILSRYPDLASIKDLGTLLQSPWKQKFFRLLGETRSLDELEHEMIRARGAFDDPRIHFAVVCASIGCPMLRSEAYTAERLESQLDDAQARFLSDRDRNRFDAGTGTLKVSRIFEWYRKDFELGHKGYDSLNAVFARHAGRLADADDARDRIRAGTYRLEFLPYDWGLNDARENLGIATPKLHR